MGPGRVQFGRILEGSWEGSGRVWEDTGRVQERSGKDQGRVGTQKGCDPEVSGLGGSWKGPRLSPLSSAELGSALPQLICNIYLFI